MELRRFGPTGREVSVIGQGTWDMERAERGTVSAALQRGIDLGMTHIDTAAMYGSGAAEEIVGEAISGRREEVFLVSKVLPENASLEGTIKACQGSLARLRRGSYQLEDTIEAFDELEADGKILSWGVSNFDEQDLEETLDIAGAGAWACDQVLYHLEERAIEHAVLPWCEKHGVAATAYSPFGHGRFPGPDTPGGRLLKEIADAHNATPRQVALRFLVRRPLVFAIPKASNPKHAAENAGAGSLHLTEEELARIDKAFPRKPRPRELPVL